MSDEPQERSEVRVALSRGKRIGVDSDERGVRYRFIDGDGLLLTIDRVTTRAGTSIRLVHTVGFEFRPDTPFDTDIDLREWAAVGYCRFGARKMQFDSGEFMGHARISPRDTHTVVQLDATFTNPRVDLCALERHAVTVDLSAPSPRSQLVAG
jgi:hypothetical protein